MSKSSVAITILTAAAVGGVAAYVIATNKDIREKVQTVLGNVMKTSLQSVNEMTEEAAMKTARATKNPKINQAWVENQWKNIGMS